MEVNNRINAAIESLLPDAAGEFRNLVARLPGLQGSDRLVLLNALVLTGPAYAVLESRLERLLIPESVELQREIAVVQQIPTTYLRDKGGGFIDIEIEHFVSPTVEIHPLPPERVPVFLQASTDTRLVPFGRLISYLGSAPAFDDHILRTPGVERSIAFALHVMATNEIRFAWWPELLGGLRDPVARLVFLYALKTAIAKDLIPPETSSACLRLITPVE